MAQVAGLRVAGVASLMIEEGALLLFLHCAFVANVLAASSQFMMPWNQSGRGKKEAAVRTHFCNCNDFSLWELVAGIAMLAEELGIAMGCCFTAWDQIAWICLQKLLGAAMGSHCFPSDRVQISGNCNVESELKAHLFFE